MFIQQICKRARADGAIGTPNAFAPQYFLVTIESFLRMEEK